MQPWCWNLELSCAKWCSQAGSGMFWVLRQIPATISKPVFLLAGYNFAKKGISAMKAQATSLPYNMSSQIYVRSMLKKQLLKYFCVHKVLYLLCLSQKYQDSPGKKITLLCSPKISAWGRTVGPSGGVRGLALLGDYPCSCSAALAALCSTADAGAQHPSWQGHNWHMTGTQQAPGLAQVALRKLLECEMG